MADKTQEQIAAEYNERERIAIAAADAELKALLTGPAVKDTIYETPNDPKTIVRVFGPGAHTKYFALVEVDGLAPYRTTTAEERVNGILSLNPPAAKAQSIDALLRNTSRAVQAAIFGTPGGEDMGPGDLAMIHYRTTRALRTALRKLGENI